MGIRLLILSRNVLLLSLIGLVLALFLMQVRRTPRFADVQLNFRSLDRLVLDRHGQILDEVRRESHRRRLNWVALEKVTPIFIQALLAAEDRRFYRHPGFDPMALSHGYFAPGTITMQLSEMLEYPGASPGDTTSSVSKWTRLWRALVLEISWNKHDILEAYINLRYFRNELQGVGAASFALFDKSPQALTRSEAALLAALAHSSATTVIQARARACALVAELGAPEACGDLSVQHLRYLEQEYALRPFVHMAPQLAKRLANDPAHGSFLRSTLDRQIQWLALRALQQQAGLRDGVDGAAVVIDNSSGEVLAYASAQGTRAKSGEDVDALTFPHPAESTLQPLLFAQAMDERILTAATELESSSLVLTHLPRHRSRDLIRVREAVTSELNIPAIHALEWLGVEAFTRNLSALGLANFKSPEFYGPSLAIGASEVNLLELSNAYRTFANGGVWSPLRFSPDKISEQGRQRVFSEGAAFLMTDILSDAASPSWLALKTVHQDDWAVAFSDRYTVGVWTGLDGGAARLARELMEDLRFGGDAVRAPSPPRGVQRGLVNGLTSRSEWFLNGTTPVPADSSPSILRSRISYPQNQTQIAWHGEPAEREGRGEQRLFIQVVAPQPDQNLYINGRRIGRAKAYQPWEFQAGRFTLELRDSQGQVVDRVRFEVLGPRFASTF